MNNAGSRYRRIDIPPMEHPSEIGRLMQEEPLSEAERAALRKEIEECSQ